MAYFMSGSGGWRGIPPVTRNVLIINVVIWLACFLTGVRGERVVVDVLGLHYFRSEGFYLHQLITYMFTHEGLMHLFFNMFAVYMFGKVVESVWGARRFLTYYMVTGIGAGLVQLLVSYIRIRSFQGGMEAMGVMDWQPVYNAIPVTIGASGSVFGLLLAFGMLFPNVPLYLMFIPVPIKAKYMVIGYGVLEFFFGVANRASDNVAHFAHLGGMLFGILLILYWRRRGFGYGGGLF
jgi:membrane associated rhomboid family serine protease